MNRALLENWNSVVKPDDTTYILGDLGFGDYRAIIERLNGKIVAIQGSHDKQINRYSSRFESIHTLLDLVIDKQPVTLCHYAMRTWHRSHFNAWHCYGHSHGTLKGEGKSMDVGVDTHNYTPYSWVEICEIMNGKPDNFNKVVARREITW
jgi:calcineurin-like phosphoesterase family protein